MDTNYLENNYLTLVGKVTGEKRFSHEIYGERFFIFNLSIPRLSGNADIIPITVSERLVSDDMLQEGKRLLVKGQFRSYNSYENEKNKLILTVFAKDIEELKDEEEDNEFVKKDGQNRKLSPKTDRWRKLVDKILQRPLSPGAELLPGPGQEGGQGGLLLPLQQVADQLVGQQESPGGQPPAAFGGVLRPPLGREVPEALFDGGEVHKIGAPVLPLLDAPGGA